MCQVLVAQDQGKIRIQKGGTADVAEGRQDENEVQQNEVEEESAGTVAELVDRHGGVTGVGCGRLGG